MCTIVDKKGNRLDKFLASQLDEFSRSKIQAMISSGCISIDGQTILDPNFAVKFKSEITLRHDSAPQKLSLTPDASVEFVVLYEDEDLIVVDKPAGVVVHPGAGNYEHTLVNGLAHYCGTNLSTGSDDCRPGIVHRIDKDTSGILVVAKNDQAHAGLARQFHEHSIERKYVCFCYGIPGCSSGKIETQIARSKLNRLKMAVTDEDGKHALTSYRTLRTFSKYAAKIECELHTGRTHQIRVHMSHIGHSLIGDSLYKVKNYAMHREIAGYVREFPRQALHARLLSFIHPITAKVMRFESEIPEDMTELEEIFGQL